MQLKGKVEKGWFRHYVVVQNETPSERRIVIMISVTRAVKSLDPSGGTEMITMLGQNCCASNGYLILNIL